MSTPTHPLTLIRVDRVLEGVTNGGPNEIAVITPDCPADAARWAFTTWRSPHNCVDLRPASVRDTIITGLSLARFPGVVVAEERRFKQFNVLWCWVLLPIANADSPDVDGLYIIGPAEVPRHHIVWNSDGRCTVQPELGEDSSWSVLGELHFRVMQVWWGLSSPVRICAGTVGLDATLEEFVTAAQQFSGRDRATIAAALRDLWYDAEAAQVSDTTSQ